MPDSPIVPEAVHVVVLLLLDQVQVDHQVVVLVHDPFLHVHHIHPVRKVRDIVAVIIVIVVIHQEIVVVPHHRHHLHHRKNVVHHQYHHHRFSLDFTLDV